MKNFWPTTDGDITILNSLKYYWDASVPYSYPSTGGSTWYDIGPTASYRDKNNGIFAGNAVYDPLGGGSIYLDGTGDWITSFPNVISNNNSRTVGIIFRTTSSAQQGVIATRGSAGLTGWSLILNPTAGVYARWSNFNSATSDFISYTTLMSTNTWYHFTHTYDRAAQDGYLYVNGTQVASNLAMAVDDAVIFTGVFGALTSAFANPFTGYIGLVYIADSVFTSTQVTTLHNIFKGRFGL
jgi:hypothetical protein